MERRRAIALWKGGIEKVKPDGALLRANRFANEMESDSPSGRFWMYTLWNMYYLDRAFDPLLRVLELSVGFTTRNMLSGEAESKI